MKIKNKTTSAHKVENQTLTKFTEFRQVSLSATFPHLIPELFKEVNKFVRLLENIELIADFLSNLWLSPESTARQLISYMNKPPFWQRLINQIFVLWYLRIMRDCLLEPHGGSN